MCKLQKEFLVLQHKLYLRGVLGGGREGVVRSEYQTASDRNRAALLAQLNQQGFGQAQQLAQQNFMNQMGLAQTAPQLFGQQISALRCIRYPTASTKSSSGLSAQQQLAQQTTTTIDI